MKNRIIILILIGVFLCIGTEIACGKLLQAYVFIKGTAQVSAPELYIGSVQDEELLINQKPENCQQFTISSQYRTFKTKALGNIKFNYTPKAKFYVRAKSAGLDPQKLRVSFGYYEQNSTIPHYLCSEIITVQPQMSNYTTNFKNCVGASDNIGRLFFEFKEACEAEEGESCGNIQYVAGNCAGGFYTKIELSK